MYFIRSVLVIRTRWVNICNSELTLFRVNLDTLSINTKIYTTTIDEQMSFILKYFLNLSFINLFLFISILFILFILFCERDFPLNNEIRETRPFILNNKAKSSKFIGHPRSSWLMSSSAARSRDDRFGTKVGQIGTKWGKSFNF